MGSLSGAVVNKQMSSNSNRLKKSSHADRANSHTIGQSMGLNKHHHSSVSAGLNQIGSSKTAKNEHSTSFKTHASQRDIGGGAAHQQMQQYLQAHPHLQGSPMEFGGRVGGAGMGANLGGAGGLYHHGTNASSLSNISNPNQIGYPGGNHSSLYKASGAAGHKTAGTTGATRRTATTASQQQLPGSQVVASSQPLQSRMVYDKLKSKKMGGRI